jgi:hypothetical protein
MSHVPSTILEGPRHGFKTAAVQTAEGMTEYMTIEERFIKTQGGISYIPVLVVGEDPHKQVALIRLPVEADSGANRVWVRSSEVLEEDEVIA